MKISHLLLLLNLLLFLKLASWLWKLFELLSANDLGGGRLCPGTVLGRRFRVRQLLGSGGIGEVYLAYDRTLEEDVALKLLSREVEEDEAHISILKTEVKYARRVQHPSVCQVYDLFEASGYVFFTMKYLDGETLSQLLHRIGRLPSEKALELASDLSLGLTAIHREGILHCDLKPGNVMIDSEGHIKICDFGLVSVNDSSAPIRGGTRRFMAPENLAGGRPTERSDLYSLGLVVYEMFTGQHPFDEHRGTYRPPKSLPGVDAQVEHMILSCLESDPADRPASADQVAAVIGRSLAN